MDEDVVNPSILESAPTEKKNCLALDRVKCINLTERVNPSPSFLKVTVKDFTMLSNARQFYRSVGVSPGMKELLTFII